MKINNEDFFDNRNYPKKIPFGWYFIGFSDSFQPYSVNNISLFGSEWVVFRTGMNKLAIIEPYCPHLGAHLGFGGRVVDESIVCPFHEWHFDVNGICQHIPYSKRNPNLLGIKKCINSLPIIEKDKMIWVWYHPQRVDPLWEFKTSGLTNYLDICELINFEFQTKTSIQDIIENSADYTHFKSVHGHQKILKAKTTYSGIKREILISDIIKIKDHRGNVLDGKYEISFKQTGPGQVLVTYKRLNVELYLFFLLTPITYNLSRVTFSFFYPLYPEDSYEFNEVNLLMREKVNGSGKFSGIEEDIRIWDNKIYREKPLYCDGDYSVIEFRRWFKQFFV